MGPLQTNGACTSGMYSSFKKKKISGVITCRCVCYFSGGVTPGSVSGDEEVILKIYK